jgi:hypothetical protein
VVWSTDRERPAQRRHAARQPLNVVRRQCPCTITVAASALQVDRAVPAIKVLRQLIANLNYALPVVEMHCGRHGNVQPSAAGAGAGEPSKVSSMSYRMTRSKVTAANLTRGVKEKGPSESGPFLVHLPVVDDWMGFGVVRS